MATAPKPPYINTTILKAKISKSTPAKLVNVRGFRRYSILARFKGKPGESFKMEINNDNLLVKQEFITLNSAGWRNFAAEYTVYGPKIGAVIYHPPANLQVNMKLYAGL